MGPATGAPFTGEVRSPVTVTRGGGGEGEEGEAEKGQCVLSEGSLGKESS